MKTHGKLKWYYQTWFIVLLFAAWPVYIPPLVGIFLLIKQYSYLKESANIMETYGDFENLKSKTSEKIEELKKEVEELKAEKKTLTDDIFITHYDFSSYDGITSQECKNKLA